MTAKDALHEVVERMSEAEAAAVLAGGRLPADASPKPPPILSDRDFTILEIAAMPVEIRHRLFGHLEAESDLEELELLDRGTLQDVNLIDA